MPEDAQIAESSTAVVESPAPEAAAAAEAQANTNMETWTPAQHRKFMETGEVPTTKPTKEAEAAPAKAEGDQPTGEAATPKQPGQKKSADERIQQVLAERNRERMEAQREREALAAKIRELEARGTQPQPAQPKAKESDALVPPNEADFETYEAFRKAEREYLKKELLKEMEDRETAKAQAAARAERERYEAEVMAGWEERVREVGESEADAQGFYQALENAAQLVKDNAAITEFIMTDELGPQMGAYLGRNLQKARELLGITSAGKMITALTALKDEVRGANKAPASAVPLPTKPLSKAAPPPTQVSTAATAPADEVDAAVLSFSGGNENAAGDYIARMNARELKQRRG